LPDNLTGYLVFHAWRRPAVLLVALTALGTGVSACAGSGSTPTATSASQSTTTSSGVTVSGAFGSTPTVNIPNSPAPKDLTSQTLTQGSGATVAAGDTLVANYVGETWADKKVFDSSFSRGNPAPFVIGKGQVIPGWDKELVGKKVGSRVLLTVPPADGYGSKGNSQAGIKGTDTLVFVVDLVAAYGPNAGGPGTPAPALPAGWPKVSNTPGTKPDITSVAGVKTPTKPESKLVVTGTGDPIDPSKTLMVQLVQTDLATGKKTQATWGQQPQEVSAQNVLQVASALSGQKIGSRAVVLVPGSKASGSSPAQPASVLVIDVVGQF